MSALAETFPVWVQVLFWVIGAIVFGVLAATWFGIRRLSQRIHEWSIRGGRDR